MYLKKRILGAVNVSILATLFFSFVLVSPAAALIPSDPLYSEQWYLPKVHAETAWDISTGSPDVVIAILDSGVDIDHPDIRPNLWVNAREIADNNIDDDRNGYIDDIFGWDFLSNVSDPRPKFDQPFSVPGIQHGTIIAGMAGAAGSNVEGVTGISFQSKIMSLRVLDGRGIGETEAVVKALDYAVANGADVVNLSFIGTSVSQPLVDAVERAYNSGVVVVAPSGNDREKGGIDLDTDPRFPICHDNGRNLVIGVAALDERDQRAVFSNYGRNCVDVSAPGTAIFSTQVYRPALADFENRYGGWWSGTSLAAPLVTGAAALMRAVNPRLSPGQVRDIIRATADSITTQNPLIADKLGGGRLNIAEAVRAAKEAAGGGGKLKFQHRAEYVAVAPSGGGGPHVKIFTYDGRLISQFFAYEPSFRGGVEVALIDRDGDGTPEVVTAPGPGREPMIKIFSLQGEQLTEFYGYHPRMRLGVRLAAGDVNGDGRKDIILTPRKGGGPHVRAFDLFGNVLGEFMALDAKYRGGLRASAADIDADKKDEIFITQSTNGDTKVHIFELDGRERFSFPVYGDKYPGDISLAASDIDGDGWPEIVVGMGQGVPPHIRIFDRSGTLLRQSSAYSELFRGGVEVSLVDIDGDGRKEIVSGPRAGGGPHVRIFAGDGFLRSQFFAFPPAFRGGIQVSGG